MFYQWSSSCHPVNSSSSSPPSPAPHLSRGVISQQSYLALVLSFKWPPARRYWTWILVSNNNNIAAQTTASKKWNLTVKEEQRRFSWSWRLCHRHCVMWRREGRMETRFGDQGGYLATELQPSNDVISNEFESFYTFPGSDTSKKLTQLTAPAARFHQDSAFFGRSDSSRHSMDIRGFSTSVSVEESDFLDEFMARDYPPGSRDRSAHGSMQDLSFCGSLTELDNLPRHPESTSSGFSSSSSSSSQQQGFKFSTVYDHEQENRFPGTRRMNSGFGSGELRQYKTCSDTSTRHHFIQLKVQRLPLKSN